MSFATTLSLAEGALSASPIRGQPKPVGDALSDGI